MTDDAEQTIEGRPVDEVAGRLRVWWDKVRLRIRTGRTGTDVCLPWLTVLLTTAAAIVAALPFQLAWLAQRPWHVRSEGYAVWLSVLWTVARRLLDSAWTGAVLGFALVASDGALPARPRTFRWVIAGGVVATILMHVTATPSVWVDVIRQARVNGLGPLRQWWLSYPSSVASAWFFLWNIGARAFLGWWLARAVATGGLREMKLAWAGAEAKVIAFVVLLPQALWFSQHSVGREPGGWFGVWNQLALSMATGAFAGALTGLGLAMALSRSRGRSPVAAESAEPLA